MFLQQTLFVCHLEYKWQLMLAKCRSKCISKWSDSRYRCLINQFSSSVVILDDKNETLKWWNNSNVFIVKTDQTYGFLFWWFNSFFFKLLYYFRCSVWINHQFKVKIKSIPIIFVLLCMYWLFFLTFWSNQFTYFFSFSITI